MSPGFQREERIFHEALQLSEPGERRRFVERACGSDASLRSLVESLLAAHEAAPLFFEESRQSLKDSLVAAGVRPEAVRTLEQPLPLEERPGDRIGHYILVRKIGEGGCGSVYLAEQLEPVRRYVALKIIKLGMNTRTVIARFEAERQALALMDHPNIAHVFDAGATETGRPYFVMELVHGVRITDYCDQNRLDIPRRLELFIQVCHAIQHAHQKGIVHRDIKPSNILVIVQDSVPVPKVIDFGIAKATDEAASGNPHLTDHGSFIGTPAYISPEQAQMRSVDVDTRSDIYSLGVLLYELLTGDTPFEGKKLLESGVDEMRRILREEEPARPSLALGRRGQSGPEEIAVCRASSQPRLIAQLQGDLDAIVMKSLEKDRQRRYETADGLAMDVRRHLNHEAVFAQPPSRVYRLGKLVRRNRLVFASGAAVALALLLGLGTATWSLFRERQARREAEVRQKITQAAFAASQERHSDAERILLEVSNLPPSLESALVFRSVGEWHALKQEWPAAAERYSALMRMNAFDNADTASLDLLRCASVFAQAGGSALLQELRARTLERFGATRNPLYAERALRSALLLPSDPRFCSQLSPLAQGAMRPVTFPVQSSTKERSGHPRRAGFALLSANSFDGRRLELRFSHPLSPATATNPAHFQLSSGQVTNAVLSSDGQSVALDLASEITGPFTVSVQRVKSAAQEVLAESACVSGLISPLRYLALGDAAARPHSVSYCGNVAIIDAGGSDCWYQGDHFTYQFLPATNDFDLALRVQSVKDTDGTGFARVGLMARDSLTNLSARMVMVERNAGVPSAEESPGTFQVTYRTIADSPRETGSQPASGLPPAGGPNSWIRLKRAGTTFSCFSRTNDGAWMRLYEFDGAASGDRAFANRLLYVGIAASAHSRSNNTLAVISDFGPPPHDAVEITSQPTPVLEWRAGAPATLRAAASGFPLFFQWAKDGVPIPGATNRAWSVAFVKPTDAGRYSVRAYNDVSSVTSDDITVTVRGDADPPIVESVVSYDGRNIGVSFSKPMDPLTATNPGNYSVGGVPITNALLLNDGRMVALQLQEPLRGEAGLSVSHLQDAFQNPIAESTRFQGSIMELRQALLGDAARQPAAADCLGNVISISAGGSDIGDSGDHFAYQYLAVTNDFDFRLRVRSVRGEGGTFARTGLMARESASNSLSRHIMVAVNAGGTFQVIVRPKSNVGASQSQPPNPLPPSFDSNSWVRLQRIGTTFHAYCSDDGETWTKLHQFDSSVEEDGPFANALCLGVATSAWSEKKNINALVSDFSATQTTPPGLMLSLGLLEHRLGDHLKAAQWARRCITHSDYQPACVAMAHALLAMTYRHLHQPDEARAELSKARSMIETQAVTAPGAGNATQGYWFDWLSARILVKEAAEQELKAP
jgi:serine/threonine protein kinase